MIKQPARYLAPILAVFLGIGAMVVEATNGQPSIWFAGRMRTERGTHAAADHLLDVARQTMEPMSVSLWLRNRRV